MPWRGLLVVVAVAFVLRLAAGFWWQQRLGDHLFGFGDSESYWHLAEDIARGRPYAYGSARVFRAPGYPLLLSPLFYVSQHPPVMAARAVNALLGTLAVGITMLIARQIRVDGSLALSNRASLLSGVLATLYPGAIAMSVFVLSEAPFAPLLMLQLYCHLRLLHSPHPHRWALTVGVCGALATLVRPSWLLFTPALAGFELLRLRFHRRGWLHACCLALGLCIVMTPWWIRNYQVTGRFVATTLQLGASLMDGLGPQANGASNMDFVHTAYAQLKAEDAQTNADPNTFEFRLNEKLRDESVAWARNHPAGVIQLAWVKLKRIWNPMPNSQEFGGRLQWLVMLGFTPLLLATVMGWWRLRNEWAAWLLLLPALYLTSLHVIFVGSIRYRQPAMLALTPLAALGCMKIFQRVGFTGAMTGGTQNSSTDRVGKEAR